MEPRVQIWNQDCIAGMAERLQPESINLIVTSIPFEELFTYSGKPEDVGNNGSTVDIRAGRFALNMRFVVEQAFRVLKPGCNFCCHIQQLLAYKVQHGFMGRRDFRGAMVDVFGAGGFTYTGEAAIPKNPQAMAQRLNLHSLQFKTGVTRDSSQLMPAVNDFLLIFRKPGDNPFPPKCLYDKKRNPKGWVTTEEWIKWAKGTWEDIAEIDVIDGSRLHKEQKHEKHVCPLQCEVIRRCVMLYSNPISIDPDSTVLDPFMGIGSTAYVALGGLSPFSKAGVGQPRHVAGFELKESYYAAALDNAQKAIDQQAKRSAGLFDGIKTKERRVAA